MRPHPRRSYIAPSGTLHIMSELSKHPTNEGRFIDHFPPAYNAVHGTQFAGEPERPTREQGWDYRWRNADGPMGALEVQHTVGASNALLERVHGKNSSAVFAAIQRHLKTAGYRGHVISVDMTDTPRNKKFRDEVTQHLCGAIDTLIAAGIPVGQRRTYGGKWQIASQNPGCFKVEVSNVGGTGPASLMLVPTPNGFYENTGWRLAEAVRQKSEHVAHAETDIVLLVDFDLNGFDYEDVEALARDLQDETIPFREVWIADLGQNTKVERVWSRKSALATSVRK